MCEELKNVYFHARFVPPLKTTDIFINPAYASQSLVDHFECLWRHLGDGHRRRLPKGRLADA